MNNKTIYMFLFLVVLFSVQQLNALGIIEFVKDLRESTAIREKMRNYYESNKNVETIVFMDNETKDNVSTELILKNNINFRFKAYYDDNELKISMIKFFGNYYP